MKKESYCKFLTISFLSTDRGVVEILNLHRKWENEKMKNIVLFQIRLLRELCFWKCKILLHLRVLEFRPQVKKKNCKQNFTKTLISLCYFMYFANYRYLCGQFMTKFYTPSVPRDNLPKKSIHSSLFIQLLMQNVVWKT